MTLMQFYSMQGTWDSRSTYEIKYLISNFVPSQNRFLIREEDDRNRFNNDFLDLNYDFLDI